MTIRRVAFHPEAIMEAEAAIEWYAERSSRAAESFLLEIEAAVAAIAAAPERWPLVDGSSRRYLLRRFPYALIYRRVDESIEVLAVAHGRRRPGFWRSRSNWEPESDR